MWCFQLKWPHQHWKIPMLLYFTILKSHFIIIPYYFTILPHPKLLFSSFTHLIFNSLPFVTSTRALISGEVVKQSNNNHQLKHPILHRSTKNASINKTHKQKILNFTTQLQQNPKLHGSWIVVCTLTTRTCTTLVVDRGSWIANS